MQRWLLPLRRARPCLHRPVFSCRPLSSSSHVEHVSVPCASNGSITLSLRNVSQHPPSTPLVICLPPFASSSPAEQGAHASEWLPDLPTVTINYRWPGTSPGSNHLLSSQSHSEDPEVSLSWPNPLHDVLFGYSWIIENLSSPNLARRDIYVYGSFVGAGLAASLALTESHSHQPVAVRGLVAYNGIYNWTTFLADHPIHRAKGTSFFGVGSPDVEETKSLMFGHLKEQFPLLFDTPAMLFDTFASPCLFFHNPGLHVPPEFESSAFSRAIDAFESEVSDSASPSSPLTELQLRAPRKAHLVFPPRKSTLKIPHTLLLHDTPPKLVPALTARGRTRKKKDASSQNSFAAQAHELATLMRRSVEKLELKERQKWDDEFEDWDDEPERRVQVATTETEGLHTVEMGPLGQAVAQAWLSDRLGNGL